MSVTFNDIWHVKYIKQQVVQYQNYLSKTGPCKVLLVMFHLFYLAFYCCISGRSMDGAGGVMCVVHLFVCTCVDF